jgi:hypothetical protein
MRKNATKATFFLEIILPVKENVVPLHPQLSHLTQKHW